MLARFTILLPQDLHFAAGVGPPSDEFTIDAYQVTAGLGYVAIARPEVDDRQVPITSVMTRLEPVEPPEDPTFLIGDQQSRTVNAIVVDFRAPTFDRTSGAEDPSWQLAMQIANQLLGRMRVVLRGPHLKELNQRLVPSRFVFREDDGSELQRVDGLPRA